MNLLNKIKLVFKASTTPPEIIRQTKKNIENWPYYSELLTKGRIKFDNEGRLRYKHGAPVGDLILARVNKDGTPKYKESAKEWFDPESEKAKNFKWLNRK